MGINCRYFIVRQLKNPLWAPSKIANSAKRVGVTDTNRLKQQCKLTEDFLAEMSLCLSLVGNQRQPTGLWFSCQMPVMSLVTVGRLDQRRTLVNAITFDRALECFPCVRPLHRWFRPLLGFVRCHQRLAAGSMPLPPSFLDLANSQSVRVSSLIKHWSVCGGRAQLSSPKYRLTIL